MASSDDFEELRTLLLENGYSEKVSAAIVKWYENATF
jgi:hypothetical protein